MQLDTRRIQKQIGNRQVVQFQVLRDGEVVLTCGSQRAAFEEQTRIWDARPQSDRTLEQLYVR